MKKLLTGLIVLGVLGGGGWWGYQRWGGAGAADETPKRVTKPVARGALEALVVGTGAVEAQTLVEVKSRASGQVVTFAAREGDEVRRGQLLVQLDGTEEQRSLQVAQASLAGAEADAARAAAGLASLEAEYPLAVKAEAARVASAQAALERARIALTLYQLEHPATIATLEAQRAAAQADAAAAANTLARQEGLRKQGQISDAEVEAARAASGQKAAALRKLELDLTLARSAFPLHLKDRQRELDSLQASLDGAKATLGKLTATHAQTLLQRQAELRTAQARATSAGVERDRAQDRVDQAKIYSDIDGVLVSKLVEEGQIIASGISSASGGTALANIADMDALYVVADVDESDIGKVRPGQRARITVDAYPDTVFSGRVSSVAPQGTEVSSVVVFKVRILVYSLRRRALSQFLRSAGERGSRGAGGAARPPRAGGANGEARRDGGARRPAGGSPGVSTWARTLGLDADQKAKARAAFGAFAKVLRARRSAGEAGDAKAREQRRSSILAARKALDDALRVALSPAQFAQLNERLLRIGMSASVEIQVGQVPDGLLIPTEAVRREKGQRGVYVLAGETPTFRPLPRILLDTGIQVAVPLQGGGVKEGEQVVVRGMKPSARSSGGGSRGFLPGMGGRGGRRR